MSFSMVSARIASRTFMVKPACSVSRSSSKVFPRPPLLCRGKSLYTTLHSRSAKGHASAPVFRGARKRDVSIPSASRARPSPLRLTSGTTQSRALAATRAAQTSAEIDSRDGVDRAASWMPFARWRLRVEQAARSLSSKAAPVRAVSRPVRKSIWNWTVAIPFT